MKKIKNENKKSFYQLSLFLGILAFVFVPAITYCEPLGGIKGLLNAVKDLVKSAIPLAYGLCILFFFWGVGRFILSAGDQNELKKSKGIIIYGIIGIFVVSSVFGIVALLQSILGIKGSTGSSSGAPAGTQNGGGNVIDTLGGVVDTE
jgi:hypothetical protein